MSLGRQIGAYPNLIPFERGCAPGPGRTSRRFASTGETLREAAKRLGVTENTILGRLSRDWGEQQALTLPKGTRVRRRPKGISNGARPGVKLSPPTSSELVILRCLADGFTPTQIHEEGGFGVNLRALHHLIDRMRLKLDAFTTAEMVAVAIRRGIIA